MISTAKGAEFRFPSGRETRESHFCLYDRRTSTFLRGMKNLRGKEGSSKLHLQDDCHPHRRSITQPTKTKTLKPRAGSTHAPGRSIRPEVQELSMPGDLEKGSDSQLGASKTLPGLCQSPRFRSGSARTRPAWESGPW